MRERERETESEGETESKGGRVDDYISLLYLVNLATIQHNVSFKHSLYFICKHE